MPSVARTMLCGAILVTVAYIAMCAVYVVGPDAGVQVAAADAAPARAEPSAGSRPAGASGAAAAAAGLVAGADARQPAPRAEPVAPPLGPCCDDLPSALARAVPQSEPRMVLATFCNAAFRGMVLNFAEHLRRARIPHVVGAVDREAFALMQAAGSPAYLIDIGHVDGSSSHSGASWKKFAVTRTGEVAKIVALGYAVIMTDVDVLWLRDPRPYLHACGDNVPELERPSCTQLLAADVLASSDNLSPGKNMQQAMGDAYWGTFNTGIVVIRATPAGVAFAAQWHAHISDGRGAYAGLTSDQQVFNRLVRAGPPPQEINGKWTARRAAIVLGTLPTMLFANGHGYFVHRIQTSHPGARPYAAHATYTYDGSSAQAKEQRFRDAGHWALPEPADAASGTFLAIGAGDLSSVNPHGELGLGAHLAMLRHQLRNLRDGLALATALGRTLVLPHFTCYADKVWAGHDNIFVFAHMYPGAHADGNYLPFECPVDHVLQLSAWRKQRVAYRDARFAEAAGALANSSLTVARVPGGAADAPGTALPRHARLADFPPRALTDVEAREQLNAPGSATAEATVLKVLPSAHGTFCGFADGAAAATFDAQFAQLIGSIEPWCSECHGSVTFAQPSRRELLALGTVYGEGFERAGAGSEARLSLDALLGAANGPVGDDERLSVEKVPRRADFGRAADKGTVTLRVSVQALATADVSGVLSPSLVFTRVPTRLWHDLTRSHAARKYSKCADFIPPDVLALGNTHVIASRDGGQGTQFCVPYSRLLPPPFASAERTACGPSGGGISQSGARREARAAE